MTATEICKALEAGQNGIATFVRGLNDDVFFKGSDERWSPAQHVAHLTFTHKRLARVFKAKDRLPAYAGEPKSYEAIVSNYLAALQRAASAPFLRNNPFVANPESDNRETVLTVFLEETRGLRETVAVWSETELDTKAMTHPLLGDISAREMLLFMLYHDQHHLLSIQKLVRN